MTDHTGKLVLVERAVPTKDHSSYGDGEYVVLRQTPNYLYGLQLSGGYGGNYGISVYGLGGSGAGKQVPLKGAGRYDVASVDDLPSWLGESLDAVDRDIEEVLSGRKKAQWVEYVYHNAKTNSRALRALLSEKPAPTTCLAAQQFAASVPAPGDVLVVVRKGTKVEVREL